MNLPGEKEKTMTTTTDTQRPQTPGQVPPVVSWHTGGKRNKTVEIEWGRRESYEFSLCRRQDADDEFEFRLFVYLRRVVSPQYGIEEDAGFKHVGGYHSIEEAKAAADAWRDTQSS